MILSMSAGFARPVRMPVSSAAKWSTDLDIFDSASRSMGSVWDQSSQRSDQSADLFTEHDPLDVAGLEKVEDHDRHVVVHAQRQGGVVHDLDAPVQHLKIVEVLELDCLGVELRVGRVDAIDLGCFQDDVRLDLDGAKGGRRVGGEVWVAGAGGEDHDSSLLQVPDGAAPDVWLGDLGHLDRRHGARRDASPLQGILQGERVDDGGEHAHVVTGGAVESAFARGQATKDVAAPDDERDLHAHLVHALDLARDRLHHREIDAVVARSTKRLAAQLEQYAGVLRRSIAHSLS